MIAFGAGEQVRVDRRGADHAADLPHRFAHGVEERLGGVVHEMPAIGDLNGAGQRLGNGLAVAAATIARHDGDLGMSAQPVLSCRPLPIRKKRDRPAPLEIADNGPVTMVPPPGEVVDADHRERIGRRAASLWGGANIGCARGEIAGRSQGRRHHPTSPA
jgi:hypothetical protein